ncbi:MAG: hypothetical protein ABI158_14285, partial [Edaphobacter sp.]
MSGRTPFRVLLAAFVLSAAGMAQTAPAPCSPANQTADQPAAKPCSPAVAIPPSTTTLPAGQQFPFPGEPAKPATPEPNAPKPSATADHPFPTQSPDMPGEEPSRSSSSSSSRDSDTTQPPLDDVGSEGKSTRRKLPKVEKLQTPDERVDEDLNVAKFYY